MAVLTLEQSTNLQAEQGVGVLTIHCVQSACTFMPYRMLFSGFNNTLQQAEQGASKEQRCTASGTAAQVEAQLLSHVTHMSGQAYAVMHALSGLKT